MKFKKSLPAEPDINLIPFIDVLLVILIFLMLSTTWTRFNEMNLNLPSASAAQPESPPPTWVVAVNSQGMYAVNGIQLEGRSPQDIRQALSKLDPLKSGLLIKADASATHQAVVNVLEAARLSGVARITFATQGADKFKPSSP